MSKVEKQVKKKLNQNLDNSSQAQCIDLPLQEPVQSKEVTQEDDDLERAGAEEESRTQRDRSKDTMAYNTYYKIKAELMQVRDSVSRERENRLNEQQQQTQRGRSPSNQKLEEMREKLKNKMDQVKKQTQALSQKQRAFNHNKLLQ